MRSRTLVVLALLIVISAAFAASQLSSLPVGPLWALAGTAALGLVSAIFTDVISSFSKETLDRRRSRQEILSRHCLTDSHGRVPVVGSFGSPYRLGVRMSVVTVGENESEPPYVPRDCDRDLDEALTAGGVVVVLGPPGSGKTRTAYEAMRRVYPERQIVAPRDGAALSRVLDLRLPWRQVVVWLDELDRFVGPEGIDRFTVHRLTPAKGAPRVYLATLCASRLAASPDSLGGVLAVASVVRLVAEVSEGESDRAEAMSVDLTRLRDGGRTPQALIPSGRRPPAEPAQSLPTAPHCVDREDYVAELVRQLCSEDPHPVVVLGPPGIGKTTIVRAAVHHPRVAARYGRRRFYVRCEAARTASAVLTSAAASLQIPPGPDLRRELTTALASEPALIVLDNVGMPWEHDTAAAEELLEDLASVPGLALVASARGAAAPFRVRWRAPIRVGPMDHATSRDLFLSLAGEEFRTDAHLDDLVAAQDGLPLAVGLLAHVAQGEPALAGTWRRWATQRDSLMVDTGEYDRFDASIAVSLGSRRMNPVGFRLLSMMGQLPGGVHLDDLDSFLPGVGDAAAAAVRRVGLGYDDQGRLRALRPIREYLARRRPPSDDDLAMLVAHYTSLARRLGPALGTDAGALAASRLVGESGNIEAMILLGLGLEDPTPAVQAATAMEDFTRYTGYGSAVLLARAREAAARIGDAQMEGECLYRLGDIELRQSRPNEATAFFTRARVLFEGLGDAVWEAHCIKHLGDAAFERGAYAEASASFGRAETLYRDHGDIRGTANSIKCLGDVAYRRSAYPAAIERHTEALELFVALGDDLGRADCLRRIADTETVLRVMDTAAERYQEALSFYRAAGSVIGEANCLLGLGRIAIDRSERVEAKSLIGQSEELYSRARYDRGVGECAFALALCSRADGEASAALELFRCALDIFERTNDEAGQADCWLELAELIDDLAEARRYGLLALQGQERIGRAEGITRAAAVLDRIGHG